MAAYSRLILGPLGPSHGQAVVMFLFIISLASPPREAAAQSFGPPPEFGSGQPRVDIKMAVVMVLLVAVFFILGFLSVYTRQCAQHRFRGRADLGFGHSPSGWAAARGLNPDVIDTFPTFVYSTVKGHKIGKGALECAVCLNEFEDNETLRLIPKCDHVFHPDCIDAWLVSHSTCPVCRANLAPQPGEFHHTLADVLHPLHDPVGPDFISVDVEEPRANREAAEPVGDDESPEIRLIEGEKSSRPPRSRSTGFGPPRSRSTGFGPPRSRSAGRRFGGIFSRSHSTGHLLGRRGESHERFTLRLPEDVRSQLVNSTLQLARAKSTGAGLPRVGSARRGYRSGSRKDGSSYYYERFEPEARADRWVFSVVPPFISRTGSVRSGTKGTSGDDVANRSKAGSSETERPPSDRLFIGKDDIAERSSDPLRPGNNV